QSTPQVLRMSSNTWLPNQSVERTLASRFAQRQIERHRGWLPSLTFAFGRSTPQHAMANPDFDTLLNTLAPFAKQMLSKHGEFYPFGATMTPDGEVTANAGYEGNEQPETQAVIDLLTHAFRQQAAAGQIRAAGLCKDIRTIA